MAEVIIDYDSDEFRAVFHCSSQVSATAWFAQLRRILQDYTSDVTEPEVGTLSTPWWVFIAMREGIGTIFRAAGVEYSTSEEALTLLKRSADRKKKFESADELAKPTESELRERLTALGWRWDTRDFTPEQIRNVRKLCSLPAGATFSVPGAGKTTEALATFFFLAESNDRLLVVAPKNAFAAWEEQLTLCMGEQVGDFVRLRGGREAISAMLEAMPRLAIMTYQQLSRVADLVASFIAIHPTFLLLDESHKIKSGRGRALADAVLRMSHLPVGKLILSGTPMPQATSDLLPQFEFLYPEIRTTANDVAAKIRPIFVRTTKDELRLPKVLRTTIPVPFNPAQKKLYDLMRSEIARQAEGVLNHRSRLELRRLGRSVIRLLEVVSNPSLLARDIGFLHDDLLGEVLAEGAAPKIVFACERARRLAKKEQKCIIWTTFRQNVETIADQLRDLRAVFIHGGIDAGDEDDNATREGRIFQFRNDSNCFVMVANPAAAAEGISLHRVCRHAIYVDRTYNAAHYLQSEDRIHRLGLASDESPSVEILVCPGSIDESVQQRLESKVAAMASVLNDQSLSIGAEQYIPFDVDDDPESQSDLLDLDDVKSILEWLRRGE